MREAVVLAGGFGTRLQQVVRDLPKPMAPVNGRPFLAYILDELHHWEFSHVILSTGYLHEKIEAFFGSSYRGMRLTYARETEPLGTGGGIWNALQFAASNHPFVLNGDTLFRVDIAAMEQCFFSHDSLLCLALRKVPDVSRYGSVALDGEGKVICFAEKNAVHGEGYINGGVYLLDKKLFDGFQPGERFSFEKEVMEQLYQRYSFYGLPTSAYFIDIGIPEDYARAQAELLPKMEFNSSENR